MALSKRWLNKKIGFIVTLFSGQTFSEAKQVQDWMKQALKMFAADIEHELKNKK